MSKNYEDAVSVMKEVSKAVTGKNRQIKKAFAAILAGGHILIEDVPGVGKTTLALAFSKAMKLKSNRVQFTPDVLPSDILGFSMYRKETGTFEFHPGTVMCNLFLADEINRTSPKTQSALLEVMEEGMVTVDGVTHEVPSPFFVIATQNPKGSAGTQLLPESQLDRFMICMSMGYPDLKHEINIAKGKAVTGNVDAVGEIIDGNTLSAIQKEVDTVHVQGIIYEYIANLIQETRNNTYIDLGVSPRGTIACAQMAKANAFLDGRDYVIPSDVTGIFLDVAKHRVVMNTKARVAKITPENVLGEILRGVRIPASYSERKSNA